MIVMLCIFDYVELEDTSSNKEGYCYSSEPPCERDTYSEARYHEEDTSYSVTNDG